MKRSKKLSKLLSTVMAICLVFTMLFSNGLTTNVFAASDVKINVQSLELVKGNSYQLRLYNMKSSYTATYKSSSTSVASVDSTGMVTGVDYGSATITVTVKDGSKKIDTFYCSVSVSVPAISVKMVSTSETLSVGQSRLLDVWVAPNNTTEQPRWSSDNYNVATVSSNGRVHAVGVGTAHIFAQIQNGQYSMCTVTVVQ